jgi:hypothetical protein
MEIVDQNNDQNIKESVHWNYGMEFTSPRSYELLILEEIGKKIDTWEDFIARNQFGEAQEEKMELEP